MINTSCVNICKRFLINVLNIVIAIFVCLDVAAAVSRVMNYQQHTATTLAITLFALPLSPALSHSWL